jgi:hypothetical protein
LDRALPALLLLAIAVFWLLSVLIAVGSVMAEDSPLAPTERLWSLQLLDVTLEALCACVGADGLSVRDGNTAQEALSTVASVTGTLAPASLIGVVFIKMLTVRPFVWRRKASISVAAMSEAPECARAHESSDKAVIAVRFHNHFLNVVMMEERAEAHL